MSDSGLPSLFGGVSQDQAQSEMENQLQSQSDNASANASAYNNLSINYPNQSPGMILGGAASAPIVSPIPGAVLTAPGIGTATVVPNRQPLAGGVSINVPASMPQAPGSTQIPYTSLASMMPSGQVVPQAAQGAQVMLPMGGGVPVNNPVQAATQALMTPSGSQVLPANAIAQGIPQAASPYASDAGNYPDYPSPAYGSKDTRTPEQKALGGVGDLQSFAQTGAIPSASAKLSPPKKKEEEGDRAVAKRLTEKSFPPISDPIKQFDKTSQKVKKMQQIPSGDAIDGATSDLVAQKFIEANHTFERAEQEKPEGSDLSFGELAQQYRENEQAAIPDLQGYIALDKGMARQMALKQMARPQTDEDRARQKGNQGITAYNESYRAGMATRPSNRLAFAQGMQGSGGSGGLIGGLRGILVNKITPNSAVANSVFTQATNAPEKDAEAELKEHQAEREDLAESAKNTKEYINNQRYLLNGVNKEIAQRAQRYANAALDEANKAIQNYYANKRIAVTLRGQELMNSIANQRLAMNQTFNQLHAEYQQGMLAIAGANMMMNNSMNPYRAYGMISGGGMMTPEDMQSNGMPTLLQLQQQMQQPSSHRLPQQAAGVAQAKDKLAATLQGLVKSGRMTLQEAQSIARTTFGGQ